MGKFFIKKNIFKKPLQNMVNSKVSNNDGEKNVKDMNTQEKIMVANAILNQNEENVTKVKKVKKDKGLIEKTESSTIILTEDNRELLID